VDISILGPKSIKIKGKKTSFIIDPMKGIVKNSADAIVLLKGRMEIDLSRVADARIILEGPGSYEVNGTRVAGLKTPNGILYKFQVDDLTIILGYATDAKVEEFNTCQIAVVNTDANFSESFITAMEPKMTILYGDKASESAKTLGGEQVAPVSKISVTKDKFSEKMEIAILN
jgi:hypothetical protein